MLFADDSGGDERKSDGGLGCGLQVTADQRCCLYVDLVQLTHRSVSDDSPVSLGTTQRTGVHQPRHRLYELQDSAQQQQQSLNASGFDVSFHLDESNAAIAAGSSPCAAVSCAPFCSAVCYLVSFACLAVRFVVLYRCL